MVNITNIKIWINDLKKWKWKIHFLHTLNIRKNKKETDKILCKDDSKSEIWFAFINENKRREVLISVCAVAVEFVYLLFLFFNKI